MTLRHWRKLSRIRRESEKEGESTRITSMEKMEEIEGTIFEFAGSLWPWLVLKKVEESQTSLIEGLRSVNDSVIWV